MPDDYRVLRSGADTTYVFLPNPTSNLDRAVRIVATSARARGIRVWRMQWGLMWATWESDDGRPFVLRLSFLNPLQDAERFRVGEIQPIDL
jgi:hypothetical protein